MTLRASTLSIAAAAKELGMARETCMDCVLAGQIPSIQVGRRRRIPAKAVKRLLALAEGESDAGLPAGGA